MSGYTFRSEGIPTNTAGNMNLSGGNMTGQWSEESLKKWPDLCKEGRKGTLLIGLASGNRPIFPDGKKTGYFFGEALLPYEEFTKQGYKCLFISPDGTAYPDENSIQGSNAEKHAIQVWNDKSHPIHRSLQKIYRPEDFTGNNITILNGFYAAGGHQCLWSFPNATNLQNLVAKIYENGGIIGFDCHGPALLENLMLSDGTKLIAGKKATGFSTSMEEKMVPGLLKQLEQEGIHTIEQTIKLNGGEWSESSNPMGEYVIRDGRLVTGMNPASAKKLALEMIEMLNACMKLGGTTNYNKITETTKGDMNMDTNTMNLDNMNTTGMNKVGNQMDLNKSGMNELPAEFHRSPQPYEIDHPTKNV